MLKPYLCTRRKTSSSPIDVCLSKGVMLQVICQLHEFLKLLNLTANRKSPRFHEMNGQVASNLLSYKVHDALGCGNIANIFTTSILVLINGPQLSS